MVNVPTERDTINSDSIYLTQHDIEIESLKAASLEEMYKTFGQAPIPLTMVLNPKGEIIYWGNIKKIDETLMENK